MAKGEQQELEGADVKQSEEATAAAIQKALATPHARRVTRVALSIHADALEKAAAKNAALGYPAAQKEMKGDSDFLEEVVLKAFGPQTALDLDQRKELRAFFAQAVLRRLRTAAHQIRLAQIREAKQDAKARQEGDLDPVEEELLRSADKLGDWVAELAVYVAERAHHDGLQARTFQPAETLQRAMWELQENRTTED